MSESKKELIEEHKRLTRILKDGTLKERLEEYERQVKELKALLQGEEYKPEKLDKAITPDPNYKGDHQAMVDGKWYRVKNVGVDKSRPIVSHVGENWYELEGHPEGVVHQNRLEDYNPGLTKSNYGPKGAGLYDPTVNQKRKAKNVETIEGLGQNKNVKEYTSATQGTAKQQADVQAKRDLAVNRRQPVRTLADLSPEEKAKLEAEYMKKDDGVPAYQHQVQSVPSQSVPPHLQRIAFMESSGGKNREHNMVQSGIHKGTKSVSSYGLMPLYVKEAAEKYKPLKNSFAGKLISSMSSPEDVNNLTRDVNFDNHVAKHIWNYNESRLGKFTSDPEHLELLGVAAHRRGVTGAASTYAKGGIEAILNDPYVQKYQQLKDEDAKRVTSLQKAQVKLELLKSALAKATSEELKKEEKPIQQVLNEIRTRQPTDEEIIRIIQSHIPTQEEILEAEAKTSEERYRQACEEV